MLEIFRAWFTSERRKRIYTVVGAVAALLLLTGTLTPPQVDPILNVVALALALVQSVLTLSHLTWGSVASWFLTAGRVAIYSLAVATAAVVVALGFITPDLSDIVLGYVAQALTVLSSILAVIFLQPDPTAD